MSVFIDDVSGHQPFFRSVTHDYITLYNTTTKGSMDPAWDQEGGGGRVGKVGGVVEGENGGIGTCTCYL